MRKYRAIAAFVLLGSCIGGGVTEDLGMKNTSEALGTVAFVAFLAIVTGWVDR